MNLLWASNYVSQSSYSIQANLFVPRLIRAGHDVTVVHLGGGTNVPTEVDGVRVLPLVYDPLANDCIQAHVANTRAQAVISLVDVWALNAEIWKSFAWFPLTPIDHNPVPPAVANVLQSTQRPLAISRFGETQLKAIGADPLYWPLGYDPAVWFPGSKAEARRLLGIPDETFYVSFIGVNDSNPSRKGIPELLAAWSMFAAQHRGVKMRLHTSETGNPGAHGGVHIPLMIKTFGIDPTTISIVDPYRYRTGFPSAELAVLARASDVLVLPSRGEGFGLPLVEFQACGCPVITTRFASQQELCFGGWLIEGEPEWSPQSSLVMKPGIAALAEALQATYEDRDNPTRRQLALDGARDYQIDYIFERYARPAIMTIAENVLDYGALNVMADLEKAK